MADHDDDEIELTQPAACLGVMVGFVLAIGIYAACAYFVHVGVNKLMDGRHLSYGDTLGMTMALAFICKGWPIKNVKG